MTKAKLGIVAAMPEEFALLVGRFGAKLIGSFGPREFYGATHEGRDLVLVCSRIGKVAAASTATTLVERFGIQAMFLTGVAGGISSQVKIGDVVVASSLVQHDIDLKGVMGFQRFDIPLLGHSRLAPCPALSAAAQRAAEAVVCNAGYRSALESLSLRTPAAHAGLIASGDRFINETREREELQSLLPTLLCVEMEGAAMAQVCVEHDVPFAVARIVSDSADIDAAFDFRGFIERVAAIGSERMVSEFLARLE